MSQDFVFTGCSNASWCPLGEFEEMMTSNFITDDEWDVECGNVEAPAEDQQVSCKYRICYSQREK